MDFEPVWRMLTAAALVLPIGLEREIRGKAAGLRTHVVVGTASAAFAAVSLIAAPDGSAGADQTRIAAQVVSGIGFMGAGVIFASGGRVHGLTTAAALWGAAAVGVCVGLQATGLAASLTAVLVLFLWPIDYISGRLLANHKLSERTFQVIAPTLEGLTELQRVLNESGQTPYEFNVQPFRDGVTVRLVLRCRTSTARQVQERLRQLPELSYVSDQAMPDEEG